MKARSRISALVLAAGQSQRMGQPKMLLPWGQTTVIEKVIFTLVEAGLTDLYVVAGGNYKDLEEVLAGFQPKVVFNPDYANGEMLSSVQVGLRSITEHSEAALIVLGDQPGIEVQVIKAIIEEYQSKKEKIIVPSYHMHRGHPWLIDRELWAEIEELRPPDTLRDFLIQHQEMISYIRVETPSVIQDLDTPQDYLAQKP